MAGHLEGSAAAAIRQAEEFAIDGGREAGCDFEVKLQFGPIAGRFVERRIRRIRNGWVESKEEFQCVDGPVKAIAGFTLEKRNETYR